jgi:hypothetical protein
MPRVGFELTISVFEPAKTVHVLDRADIVIGIANMGGSVFLMRSSKSVVEYYIYT